MKQKNSQLSSQTNTDKIQTIDVRDRRLQQPSMLTHSSREEISEEKSALAA